MDKMQYELIKIADKILPFYIITEYEGVKEEVNIENNLLLMFSEYQEEYEVWFMITPSRDNLISYLKGELGILSLMRNSKLEKVKRYYDNFNEIKDREEIAITDPHIKKPRKDIKFRKNIWVLLQRDNSDNSMIVVEYMDTYKNLGEQKIINANISSNGSYAFAIAA